MPELPEVETIRRDLETALLGKTIQTVEIKDPAALTGIGPSGRPRFKVTPEDFRNHTAGKTIARVHRRGKYLVVEFADASALIFHLRMTGQLLLNPPQYRDRAAFTFSDGTKLYYADRRRFGEVIWSAVWREEPCIKSLGVEPLNGKFSAGLLQSFFRGRTAPVHSILLNQKLVSGLGNIYATEALFLSGIRPTKPCGKIKPEKLESLAVSIREVLRKSVEHRGYSMNTYVDAMGKKGRSQLFSLVYGKEGLPCTRCESLLRRKVIGGRGVVYCSRGQR